jgi:hypothetical protein
MAERETSQTGQEVEGGRAELRRAAFLKAARDVFLEYGYEAANRPWGGAVRAPQPLSPL